MQYVDVKLMGEFYCSVVSIIYGWISGHFLCSEKHPAVLASLLYSLLVKHNTHTYSLPPLPLSMSFLFCGFMPTSSHTYRIYLSALQEHYGVVALAKSKYVSSSQGVVILPLNKSFFPIKIFQDDRLFLSCRNHFQFTIYLSKDNSLWSLCWPRAPVNIFISRYCEPGGIFTMPTSSHTYWIYSLALQEHYGVVALAKSKYVRSSQEGWSFFHRIRASIPFSSSRTSSPHSHSHHLCINRTSRFFPSSVQSS